MAGLLDLLDRQAPGGKRAKQFSLRLSNGLEIRHEASGQPHQFDVYGQFSFGPAAAPQSPDRFFAISNQNGHTYLQQYDDSAQQWAYFGRPTNGANIATQISEVMYGNRVYLIDTDKNLWEMMFGPSWPHGNWYKFDISSLKNEHSTIKNITSWKSTTPVVLYDGSLFLVGQDGSLVNMWWNGGQWIFLPHGWCDETGSFPFKKAVTITDIGAAMMTSKIFVTCSDGTLRERWYNSANGGSWAWANHGRPPWGYADTPPVKVADGKLFLTITDNTSEKKKLVELYSDGRQWLWVDHGHAPGGWLVGAAASDPSSERVYVRCENGNYYEFSWNGSNWTWHVWGRPY
jgi:hypothetical protein